jgi:hypothetical protein
VIQSGLRPRAADGVVVQLLERADEGRERRPREPEDGLVRVHVGGLTAAVAAEREVQTLLHVRDDGRVHAGRLEHGGVAAPAPTAAHVEISEHDPRERLGRSLHDDHVRKRRSLAERARGEPARAPRRQACHALEHGFSGVGLRHDAEAAEALAGGESLRQRLEAKRRGRSRTGEPFGHETQRLTAPSAHEELAVAMAGDRGEAVKWGFCAGP